VQRGTGFGLLLGACPGTAAVPHQNWAAALFGGQRGEDFAVTLRRGRYFWIEDPGNGPPTRNDEAIELYNEDSAANGTVPLQLDFTHDVTFSIYASARPESEEVHWIDRGANEGMDYQVQCASGTRASFCAPNGECADSCDSIVMHNALPDVRQLRIAFVPGDEHSAWVRLTRTP
jgi:hypothetical protein